MNDTQRRRITVTGQVQGVGFRPFVYRLALECGLSGFVKNDPGGVHIEAQGSSCALDRFVCELQIKLPPLAKVASLATVDLEPVTEELGFRIATSNGGGRGHAVLVSPDMVVCENCVQETLAPANRRYGYPFTNCTDCGPRYSITRAIPYDRPMTSMACFSLCPECSGEYHTPADRRFHAQPNACPVCGPKMWLEAKASSDNLPGSDKLGSFDNLAILGALHLLIEGKILAIKGLGGFHLVCDAFNLEAVQNLRLRKNRPHKALAIMAADLERAAELAWLTPKAQAALQSPQRPIVICPRKSILPPTLSPDTDSIGLVLPYTPLHHLLFHPEALGGDFPALRALVMTSGNFGGEPICLGNREAKQSLATIADAFLLHDRDILVRVDDSVLFPGGCEQHGVVGEIIRPEYQPVMVRRARGFVPAPLRLPGLNLRPCGAPQGAGQNSVLAVGANLKNTFCLTRGREAFVSQHIGDLDQAGSQQFFEEALEHLSRLLEVEPQAVIRDLHPDYPSSRLAEEYARRRGIPVFTLQHHFAHIYAVMAERGLAEPCLGLALDGTGLGADGTIWGGELLLASPNASGLTSPGQAGERLGCFRPFPLPGGEAAIRSPWRIAESLCKLIDISDKKARPWLLSPQRLAMTPALMQMLERGVNCPQTSSCGRLFDAVAAVCGLCFDITYEGQAAVLLEEAQDRAEKGAYPFPLLEGKNLPGQGSIVGAPGSSQDLCQCASLGLYLDSWALFQAAAEDKKNGVPVGKIARRFHQGLTKGLAAWVANAAGQRGLTKVVLAGGTFNNRTLQSELPQALREFGLQPILPCEYPPGDGHISLGQAYWGSL